MNKNIFFIALKIGIVLGLIVSISAFIHSAMRHNVYATLIPLWVVYVFATVSCYLWAFSAANKLESRINFISSILLVAIIAFLAAVINGLEAYFFTQIYDDNYLAEMKTAAYESWKAYNYTTESPETQWQQILYENPKNYGWETTKTQFKFNTILGSLSFVAYFIRWMLKNSKKIMKRFR